ncbi:hypothetical protein STAWA0001_0362, partial [Staphylococcus warneri L37603]
VACSAARKRADTACCVTPNTSAARVNDPVSATRTRTSRVSRSRIRSVNRRSATSNHCALPTSPPFPNHGAHAHDGCMSAHLAHAPAASEHGVRDRRLFRELERPGLIVSNLTPNWFASIMGTGIVAVAAASLPLQFPGLRTAATVVWAIAAVLLVALTIATVLHWVRYRSTAAKHHLNPVISHFYGAPPMAFLTVGA